MTALAPYRPVVDRGADQPGRRPRPRRDPRAAVRDRCAVATGEHVQNRVIFKQLLQADAIDFVQLDACRVGGVNENIAILLLAAKFGSRSARTPAASGCASWSSICRCSTTSR